MVRHAGLLLCPVRGVDVARVAALERVRTGLVLGRARRDAPQVLAFAEGVALEVEKGVQSVRRRRQPAPPQRISAPCSLVSAESRPRFWHLSDMGPRIF